MCKRLVRYYVPFSTCNVFSWWAACLDTFFSDLSKLGAIKVRNCIYLFVLTCQTSHFSTATCRLFNIFDSGKNHAIHAKFMAQANIFNNGQKIGFLREASTHFSMWFYAICRLLRLKRALKATIHSAAFNLMQRTHELSWQLEILKMKFFEKVYFTC